MTLFSHVSRCWAHPTEVGWVGSIPTTGKRRFESFLDTVENRVIGEWPSGKASHFECVYRRFESYFPIQTSIDLIIEGTDKVTYSVLVARPPYRVAEWFDSTGRKVGIKRWLQTASPNRSNCPIAFLQLSSLHHGASKRFRRISHKDLESVRL